MDVHELLLWSGSNKSSYFYVVRRTKEGTKIMLLKSNFVADLLYIIIKSYIVRKQIDFQENYRKLNANDRNLKIT